MKTAPPPAAPQPPAQQYGSPLASFVPSAMRDANGLAVPAVEILGIRLEESGTTSTLTIDRISIGSGAVFGPPATSIRMSLTEITEEPDAPSELDVALAKAEAARKAEAEKKRKRSGAGAKAKATRGRRS